MILFTDGRTDGRTTDRWVPHKLDWSLTSRKTSDLKKECLCLGNSNIQSRNCGPLQRLTNVLKYYLKMQSKR